MLSRKIRAQHSAYRTVRSRQPGKPGIKRWDLCKQQSLSVGTPGLGKISYSGAGLREAFRLPCSVLHLPEEAQVALAIRLERDATPVGHAPYRIATASLKRQSPGGLSAFEIVD